MISREVGELAKNYKAGDTYTELVVGDAPVCDNCGPIEINNPYILFNGQPLNPSYS